jgi:hypothetical protein
VDHLPQDLVIHFQGLTSLFVFLVVSVDGLVVCIGSIRERYNWERVTDLDGLSNTGWCSGRKQIYLSIYPVDQGPPIDETKTTSTLYSILYHPRDDLIECACSLSCLRW